MCLSLVHTWASVTPFVLALTNPLHFPALWHYIHIELYSEMNNKNVYSMGVHESTSI